MKTPGERISTTRKQAGLSQEELAQATGKTRQVVSNWETDRSEPSFHELAAISRALLVSIEWIVTGEVAQKVELSKDEEMLLRRYRRCPSDIRLEIQATVDELCDAFGPGNL